MSKKVGIVIPTLGLHSMTHDLMRDVFDESSLVEPYIVDNEGRYPALSHETIIHMPIVERWTKSCNYVLNNFLTLHEYWVLLNNDTRLSRGFFQGLVDAIEANETVGVIAPCYDDIYDQQKNGYNGPAQDYQSREKDRTVSFVDGTCMMLTSDLIERIGVLDEENFGEYGWGADYDICIRARIAGTKVMVTERSYLNHFHQQTAKLIRSDWNDRASEEMNAGMTFKYGDGWRSWLYA